MKSHRTIHHLVAAFTLVLVLASCGKSSGSDSSPTTTAKAGAASGTTVTIKGFKFSPASLKAKVGDTITFANEDGATHTATSQDAPSKFDTGDLKKGESKTVKVTKAGTYSYMCDIHDYMKATIEVS